MPKKGKGKKGKKSSPKASAGVGNTLKGTVTAVVDEVEKAGGVVLGEIRNSFEFIGGKVADTAKAAAGTTVAVKDKVTSKEVTDQLHGLLTDVEEVGESLVKVITSHFESLRKSIVKSPKKARSRAKSKATGSREKPKPARGKKKAAPSKRPAKKKTTARKTTAVKKPAAKKKAATRKKTTVGKTVTRKPAARKATARKKTVAKKRA